MCVVCGWHVSEDRFTSSRSLGGRCPLDLECEGLRRRLFDRSKSVFFDECGARCLVGGYFTSVRESNVDKKNEGCSASPAGSGCVNFVNAKCSCVCPRQVLRRSEYLRKTLCPTTRGLDWSDKFETSRCGLPSNYLRVTFRSIHSRSLWSCLSLVIHMRSVIVKDCEACVIRPLHRRV